MPRVKVNNVEVEVPEGSFVVDAVRLAGFTVPMLCYLQGLFSEATCRVCVVKANGRVVPACRYPVQEGMNIVTDDPELESTRRINFELVLATHKVECWNCGRKGSCVLASLSRELDVEGLPVCSECPLAGSYCYVRQGVPCLGPLTVAGCDAECVRQGAPCLGCRGYLKSPYNWSRALEFYKVNGIGIDELEDVIGLFWPSLPDYAERALRKVSRR